MAAPTMCTCSQHRGEDANGCRQRAAGNVCRREVSLRRRTARRALLVEHPGERLVVDIVTTGITHRSGLAIATDGAIHERRVRCRQCGVANA